MKKILLAMAMVATCAVAFAGEGQSSGSGVAQQQKQVSTSESNAAAINAGAGNGNNVSNSTPVSIGCLVNCANTDQGSKDLADSGVQQALINAAAARDVADTTVKIRNTPSVNGQALVSSNDTCMGSASGSANVPGFGMSLGKTYTDGNCVMLKNSRELWNMGMKSAAMKLMCSDAANRDALMSTGYDCDDNSLAVKKNSAKVSAASSEQYTDPIVRARLGLAPLAAK